MIHKEVEKIIKPVYLVGGCVRDEILGREVNDWDFTTPMSPDDVEQAFRLSGRRVWDVGKRFGTIASKVQLPDGTFIKVEITTHRGDGPGRKPEVILGVSLEQDLMRRDFTMNAIAKRGSRYIDPFGGIDDIHSGIIRAVGHPRQRFKEDPLRILRAARFASQLQFTIEDDTFAKMQERAHSLLSISKERIMMEVDKILLSDNPGYGLDVMMDAGLWKYIIPELDLQKDYNQNSCYHALPLWDHTLAVVTGVEPDLNLRWAALLHDVAKPFVRTENKKSGYSNYVKHDMLGAEIVSRLATHMKWSKAQKAIVTELVLNHLSDDSPLKAADDKAKK